MAAEARLDGKHHTAVHSWLCHVLDDVKDALLAKLLYGILVTP